MEFEDDAFVLSARPHGDTGVVADLLTEHHGRRLTYVAGGASRRMKPFLQPGSRVRAAFRSRDDSQLGSARLEPRGEDISRLFDSPLPPLWGRARCPSESRSPASLRRWRR